MISKLNFIFENVKLDHSLLYVGQNLLHSVAGEVVWHQVVEVCAGHKEGRAHSIHQHDVPHAIGLKALFLPWT